MTQPPVQPATSTPLVPRQYSVSDPLDVLVRRLSGRLVRPGDADWDAARQAWNLSVDQCPDAVVIADDADDVATTVAVAREHGLRVAAQATGHHASALDTRGDLSGCLLLRTHEMREVEIDPEARIARVEAGAQWADVTGAAAEHGLAALAGSAADVGVVGYTLGGGLSWLGRSHGLAANHVTALEVVTGDGLTRRIDEHNDPHLFWSLRGGGGSSAIVTAMEMRLFPLTEVYAGSLFFPLERAGEVLHAWRAWTETVPDSVTSVGRLLRFPPLPDLPPYLSGQSFALIEVCAQLDESEAATLLKPLRALGPAMDTCATIPVAALAGLHMDPPGPVPGHTEGVLLAALPPAAIDAIVAESGPGAETPLLSVELRHLGGQLTPGALSGGAVSDLPAPFLAHLVGITPTPEATAAVDRAIVELIDVLSPWHGGGYVNFADAACPGEDLFGASYDRLRQVKAAYDPADVIRAHHPVTPA